MVRRLGLMLACAVHGLTAPAGGQTIEVSAGLIISEEPARLSPVLSVTVGTEWTPMEGVTSMALRLCVVVVPGLVLRPRLASGRELSLHMSDHVLGSVNALFGPDE